VRCVARAIRRKIVELGPGPARISTIPAGARGQSLHPKWSRGTSDSAYCGTIGRRPLPPRALRRGCYRRLKARGRATPADPAPLEADRPPDVCGDRSAADDPGPRRMSGTRERRLITRKNREASLDALQAPRRDRCHGKQCREARPRRRARHPVDRRGVSAYATSPVIGTLAVSRRVTVRAAS